MGVQRVYDGCTEGLHIQKTSHKEPVATKNLATEKGEGCEWEELTGTVTEKKINNTDVPSKKAVKAPGAKVKEAKHATQSISSTDTILKKKKVRHREAAGSTAQHHPVLCPALVRCYCYRHHASA